MQAIAVDTSRTFQVGDPDECRIVGHVARIIYSNPETGSAIIRVKVGPDVASVRHTVNGVVTMVGELCHIMVGSAVEAVGQVESHRKYGPQVKVTSIKVSDPGELHELVAFIANKVKHIDKVIAKRIVDRFGKDTLKVMDETPELMSQIKGIGEKRVGSIKEAWEQIKQHRQVLMFLTSLGIGPSLTATVIEELGDGAIRKITENPYLLMRLKRVGFATADAIARKMGVKEDDPRRITAAIHHVIDEECYDGGHTFVFGVTLIQSVGRLLANTFIGPDTIMKCVNTGVADGMLTVDGNRVYTSKLHNAEVVAAERLRAIMTSPMPWSADCSKEAIAEAVHSFLPLTPADEQLAAMERCLSSKVSVITGSPGVGKTSILRAVVAGCVKVVGEHAVLLMAPTGKAAKRMAEVIGHSAYTIHRAMAHKMVRGLVGVIVLDEVSMVDVELLARLLAETDDRTILIIVGDKHQLPSVGPGAVLRDIIMSKKVPCTELVKVFRQAEASDIVVNANSMIGNHSSGIPGVIARHNMIGRRYGSPSLERDFHIYPLDDESQQLGATVWCATHWARAMGLDPVVDVQVLSPMYRGVSGVDSLNAALQAAINPNPTDHVEMPDGSRWGIGDRLMQTKNDYELGVLNGDSGTLMAIQREDDKAVSVDVSIDGNLIRVPANAMKRMRLSYACTIHRSQGSQWPLVIVTMSRGHSVMLRRNLLYTAITRAQKGAIIVGSMDALGTALRREDTERRNTGLMERLAQ